MPLRSNIAHQSQLHGPRPKFHCPKLNTTNDDKDQDERKDTRRQLPCLKIDKKDLYTMALLRHGALIFENSTKTAEFKY